MNVRFASLGALLLAALSACTTRLTYEYDAGSDGGGLRPDGAAEGGSADGGPKGPCAGQFCDDFEPQTTRWPVDWDVLDRQTGTPGAALRAPGLRKKGLGAELEIAALGGPGGWAFPKQKFTRKGASKNLSVKLALRLVDSRNGVFLEIGDKDAPETARIAVNGNNVYVGTTDTGSQIPPGDGVFNLEVQVSDTGGSSFVTIPTFGLTAAVAGSGRLPDEVEVRFGATPISPATSLANPMTIAIDDVVIE